MRILEVYDAKLDFFVTEITPPTEPSSRVCLWFVVFVLFLGAFDTRE